MSKNRLDEWNKAFYTQASDISARVRELANIEKGAQVYSLCFSAEIEIKYCYKDVR